MVPHAKNYLQMIIPTEQTCNLQDCQRRRGKLLQRRRKRKLKPFPELRRLNTKRTPQQKRRGRNSLNVSLRRPREQEGRQQERGRADEGNDECTFGLVFVVRNPFVDTIWLLRIYYVLPPYPHRIRALHHFFNMPDLPSTPTSR